MESSLLERVRTACKAVAEKASYVRVDHDRISPYAASLPIYQALFSEPDPVHHYLGHGDDTVAYTVTLDAVNFGSGYFPHLRKRPGVSGYFTIASSLTDYYREHGSLSARELEQLTVEDCHVCRQPRTSRPACGQSSQTSASHPRMRSTHGCRLFRPYRPP